MIRKHIGRDARGVSTIEFAILSIPLFVTIMGGIEFGFMQFTRARLGEALSTATRMAKTGNDEQNGQNGEQIDAMVRKRLDVMQGAEVEIDHNLFTDYTMVNAPESKDSSGTTAPYCFDDVNGNAKWDKSPTRTGKGGPDDIIRYRIDVSYPSLFPLVTKGIGGDGTVRISGETSIMNEPFEQEGNTVRRCCVSAAAGNPTNCT